MGQPWIRQSSLMRKRMSSFAASALITPNVLTGGMYLPLLSSLTHRHARQTVLEAAKNFPGNSI